ncbi:TRAP transporter substrate-binding protein DctP [Brevibacterium antiquum]|uniref:TRAP-type C4-dicarboxylate transport system, substrate-binding protein n=1 Tax=Brevibacterium antiquum TaxID=234835 RepID=A0A2H1KGX1_9MICO|nr:TRAP transporter substrate-binding protein DctP [Brevibacterium antiquum]SMX98442.1 TRAP-type C4-dicarboxylate transport system, substrate-binding protein [Brevibacterium antiquum]
MKRIRSAARPVQAIAAIATLALLAGCAGSVGGDGSDSSDSAGEGFAFDASQDEIDEALADLDPVTLKFQPSSMSEKSILAPNGLDVKKAIEERSGGKVTVDIVWGQAIASYADVDDALADGRVDLAFTLPSYTPAEYPAFDAIGTAMSTLPSSPVASDLAANAAGVQVAWETPEVLDEFKDKDLVPLIPMLAAGGYSTMCSKPMSSAEDWKGNQIRVGSAAAGKQVTDLGATPVSLSFPETYEALQRGTVDCDLGQLAPNVEAGTFEVAPHIGVAADAGIARSAGAITAGKKYSELPVAYQQVIFDSMSTTFATMMEVVIGAKAMAVEQAKDNDGKVEPFDDDVQKQMAKYAKTLSDKTAKKAGVPDAASTLKTAGTDWQKSVTELGYEDKGDFASLDEWYPKDANYDKLGDELFDKAMAGHRPE